MSKLEKVGIPEWRLPTQRPKVLIVQPRAEYENLRKPLVVPRLHREYKAKLFAALTVALQQKAHITVFPEYTWPADLAPEMHEWLERRLPEGSACVLPFEHTLLSDLPGLLTKLGLTEQPQRDFIAELEESCGPLQRGEQAYCNFLVFAVKAAGRLFLVPQAKLYPAEFELPMAGFQRRFVQGQHLRLIQGSNITVATAICFDFIARDEAEDARPRDLLTGKERPDLFIVPECNPGPLNVVYARGLVALYSSPAWARQPPVVLFANVARGTRIPGVRESFGFSRAYGDLGALRPATHPFFRTFMGVVASRAETFKELDRQQHESLSHPKQGLLVLRPLESAVCLTLPTLGSGPTRDPEAGRLDTEVVPLRYIATEERWQPVQHTQRTSRFQSRHGIPRDLLGQARAGVHPEAEREFERQLRQTHGPVRVTGQGGSGKTTLVARFLEDQVVTPQTARVAWLDMGRLKPGSVDELQTGLLVALGKPSALKRNSQEQWDVIKQELTATPTVLVLDSFELWSGDSTPLPEPLRETAAHWPGRLVLTTRGKVINGDAVEVGPLDADEAHALLCHEAGRNVDRALSDAVHRTLGGLPLALSWVGGMLRAGRSPQEISAGLRPESEDGLEALFKHSIDDLPSPARSILGVLALLPAPILRSDLADMLGLTSEQLERALDALTVRHLVLRDTSDEGEHVSSRHPFVRQYMREDAPLHAALRKKVITWALDVLKQSGGDRRWKKYPDLWRRWRNLRSVLDLLAGSTSREEMGLFLQGWRDADYSLWSGGLWRDRIALGTKAIQAATQLGEGTEVLEAHAAYDSVAETAWHLESLPLPDILRHFERAEELLKRGDHRKELAMVTYYRSRFLRKEKKLTEARRLAVEVESTATALKDEHLRALALNTLGNIDIDDDKPDAARKQYAEARRGFENQKDPEMLAVVDRNEGKAALKLDQYGQALELFESSMSGFRDLGLEAEEAETANYHAQALARLGEREEGRAEYDWALNILENLGAKVREREFKETKRLLESSDKG
ncbi:NB-ARC domain-containing protein [Pyxidicoccus sp. 3LFB2]